MKNIKRGLWMAANKTEAEILIYERIGQDWSGDGISAKQFTEDLKALGTVKTLNIRINSPGGNVFEASAIKTQLEQHPAVKNVFIDGIAASAATYIAMAGNSIEISKNALFMIHSASNIAIGNAEDMRKMADLLDTVDKTIADAYVRRTKQTLKAVQDWMTAETWFSSDDAVKHGFADRLMAEEQAEPAASFDLSHFRNAPQVAAVAQAPAVFLADQEHLRRKFELLKARTA